MQNCATTYSMLLTIVPASLVASDLTKRFVQALSTSYISVIRML